MPQRVEIFLRQLPEQVGIASGGKDVVRLHAVVAVVGAQMQKNREILVPCIQIDRHRTLPHPELIDGDGGVVHQPDPAGHAAVGALKVPNSAADGPYLAEVHSHAAAELRDLGKVVNGSVDAVQTVRRRVDKAAGQLVMGLARVRHGRHCHGKLHTAQKVAKPPNPLHVGGGFVHGNVQRDAKKHILRRFQRHATAELYHIAPEQQIKDGAGKQRVPRRAEEALGCVDLLAGITGENVVAVQAPCPSDAGFCRTGCQGRAPSGAAHCAWKRRGSKAALRKTPI